MNEVVLKLDCEKVTLWPFEREAASAHTQYVIAATAAMSTSINLIETQHSACYTRVFIAPIYIDPINGDIVIFVPILA